MDTTYDYMAQYMSHFSKGLRMQMATYRTEPEKKIKKETHIFNWSPNKGCEYPIRVHTLPKTETFQNRTETMRHDEILKWEFLGHYCLHVQKDNNPVNPIEHCKNNIIDFVDWNEYSEMDPRPVIINHPEKLYHMCGEYACQIEELEYWQNKLAETLDSDTIAKINTDSVSDCISALQDDFVIVPFCVIRLSHEEIHEVSRILSINPRDYLDSSPYFVTSDTSWCSPDQIHSWAIISKKHILGTWPSIYPTKWKEKGEEVIQSLITEYNLYRAGSCWQYTLLKKTRNGEWEEIDHSANRYGNFFGEDIIASGMVDLVGHGILSAIQYNCTTKDRAKPHTSYAYD